MDFNTIQTMITSVGFPITCTIGLAWFLWKVSMRSSELNEKREEKLYAFITVAQATNEKLVQTNAEFISVLDTYKMDIESIKNDVNEIKTNMKG